ncbi:MAG: ABC transporter permease, partial [Bacteroidales bacterium]|nr:ABC transporter permease [Bacteroidales bacterium]
MAKCYLWLILAVLYAPIIFIAVFSFTEAKSLGNWTGFSVNLYKSLFTGNMQNSGGLISAVENTLLIALIASIVATIMGTVAAIGIFNLRGKKKQT